MLKMLEATAIVILKLILIIVVTAVVPFARQQTSKPHILEAPINEQRKSKVRPSESLMLNNQEVSMNIPHVNTSRSINNPTNAKIQASKSFSSTETAEAIETAAKYLKSPKPSVITSSKISPRSPNPKVQGDGDISASFSGISSAMKTRRLINSPEVSSDNKLLNANNLVVESRSTKKVGGALLFEAKMVSKLSPTAVRAVKQGKQSSSNSALSVQCSVGGILSVQNNR